jgi:hypothetical protein
LDLAADADLTWLLLRENSLKCFFVLLPDASLSDPLVLIGTSMLEDDPLSSLASLFLDSLSIASDIAEGFRFLVDLRGIAEEDAAGTDIGASLGKLCAFATFILLEGLSGDESESPVRSMTLERFMGVD